MLGLLETNFHGKTTFCSETSHFHKKGTLSNGAKANSEQQNIRKNILFQTAVCQEPSD